MIFSHIQRPLGMRIYRIGKRLPIHEVPSVVAWCRPYCCATIDTPMALLEHVSKLLRSELPSQRRTPVELLEREIA